MDTLGILPHMDMDNFEESLPSLTYIIAILVVAFMGFQYVASNLKSRRRGENDSGTRTRKRRDIPIAPCLPLLGSLPFMGKHICRTISRWGREKNLGSVFRVKFGNLDAVILNDYDVIRECFVKNGHCVTGRQQNLLVTELWKGDGLLFLDYGDKWKSQRHFTHTAFRQILSMGKVYQMAAHESQKLGRALRRQIWDDGTAESDIDNNYPTPETSCKRNRCRCASVNSQDKNEWTCIDPDLMFHQAGANITCRVIFGRTFTRNEKVYCDILKETPVQSRKSYAAFMTAYLIPSIRKIPPFRGIINEALKLRAATFKMVRDIVDEHIANFNEIDEDSDFIDMYLDCIRCEKDQYFTIQQLHALLFDIFTAGAETAATALLWTTLYLAKDPKLQTRIRCEVNDALEKTNGAYSSALMSNLHLLRATIHESIRIRPINGLGIPHKVTKDFDVREFTLRKGTVVMPNFWNVHHNEVEYPNSEVFDPTRHLNKCGEFTLTHHVIGFSLGPRRCLGRKVAEVSILFNMVEIIQNFEFRMPKVWNPSTERYETAPFDFRGIDGQILLAPQYWLEWKLIST